MVLRDTTHHIRPFFRWDAMLRITWAWMLLCGYDRGCCQAVLATSNIRSKISDVQENNRDDKEDIFFFPTLLPPSSTSLRRALKWQTGE